MPHGRIYNLHGKYKMAGVLYLASKKIIHSDLTTGTNALNYYKAECG